MTNDDKAHRDIREAIISHLRKSVRKEDIHYSHGEKGKIDLFYKLDNKKRIYLSEPDILVEKEAMQLVIEIEGSDSPKHILGVACATKLSQCYRLSEDKIEHSLLDPSLLIVLGATTQGKKGSRKTLQLPRITKLIRSRLSYNDIAVVKNEEKLPILDNWLNNGRLTVD